MTARPDAVEWPVRAKRIWRAGQAVTGRVSVSFAGSVVLLNDAGGDAPAGADSDALVFRPRPDIAAAVPAGRGPPRPAALSPPGLAGMIDERGELAAQRRGVLLAQIDLIFRTIHPEPHRLLRRAPIKIIFELDGYLLRHPASWLRWGYLHRTRSTVMAAGTRGAAIQFNRCARPGAISSAARQPAPGVPIANEERLVEPDSLGTTIELSFLEGPARLARCPAPEPAAALTRSCGSRAPSAAERPVLHAVPRMPSSSSLVKLQSECRSAQRAFSLTISHHSA